MTGFEYPKYGKNQSKGNIGESYINNFVHHKLEWIYRSVPQESDFGIDGYIDIVSDGNVTGQTIAVQIKCGDSYFNKKTDNNIRYDGENKHLNYYTNSLPSIILIVLNDDCSEGRWCEFNVNRTSPRKNGWWIELPENNTLDSEVKKLWEIIAGPVNDNSEEISTSWIINKVMDESDFGIYVVPKEDVLTCNFSGIHDVLERLSRNKKSLLLNRGTLEVLIDGWNDDPREIYQIPEIRLWYSESFKVGIPWFYFLKNGFEMMAFKVLLFSFCEFKINKSKLNALQVEITSQEKIQQWLEINFENLNKFTDEKNIPMEINKEMSNKVTLFIKSLFSSTG